MRKAVHLLSISVPLLTCLSCLTLEHPRLGMVRINLVSNYGDEVFFDTSEIRVTVEYGSCINEHLGGGRESLLSDYADNACEHANAPDCIVTYVDEHWIDSERYLVFVYEIGDSSTVAGSELRIGPLPTQDAAGCVPEVLLRPYDLIGRDINGEYLWSTDESRPPQVLVVDQASSVYVEP